MQEFISTLVPKTNELGGIYSFHIITRYIVFCLLELQYNSKSVLMQYPILYFPINIQNLDLSQIKLKKNCLLVTHLLQVDAS